MPDIKKYVPQTNVKEDLGGSAYHIYDFAVDGGAISTITFPLVIPNNAIVIRGFVHVLTAITTSASGTLQFGLNTTADLLGATGAGSLTANAILPLLPSFTGGIPVGAEPAGVANNTPLRLTADRNLKAQIVTGALTAGKVAIYLEYAGPFNNVLPVTYGK